MSQKKNKDERRCVSCGCVAPKQSFWRIVRNYPDHSLTIDQGMGRSAYLCPNLQCLTIAEKKKKIVRSLRVPVPPEIYQQLREKWASANN